MPTAKKKSAKKSIPLAINIDPTKKRKRNPPRTAYSKEHPSPHAWQVGVSGNPGGKSRLHDKLLSRSLRVALQDTAPDEVTEALHLPKRASWAQCLARKLIVMAIRGDLAAMREIREATEGTRLHADLTFPDPNEAPPVFEVIFVDGLDGRPSPGMTIEGRSAAVPPSLPASTD